MECFWKLTACINRLCLPQRKKVDSQDPSESGVTAAATVMTAVLGTVSSAEDVVVDDREELARIPRHWNTPPRCWIVPMVRAGAPLPGRAGALVGMPQMVRAGAPLRNTPTTSGTLQRGETPPWCRPTCLLPDTTNTHRWPFRSHTSGNAGTLPTREWGTDVPSPRGVEPPPTIYARTWF